jgi:hypothetical protein
MDSVKFFGYSRNSPYFGGTGRFIADPIGRAV